MSAEMIEESLSETVRNISTGWRAQTMNRPRRFLIAGALLLIASFVSPLCWAMGSDDNGSGDNHNRYVQHNLVSDDTSKIPADHQDRTLLNPWGVAFFPSQPFWINDNGSGISALYLGDGSGVGGFPAAAVRIPPPMGGTSASTPTGIVANT